MMHDWVCTFIHIRALETILPEYYFVRSYLTQVNMFAPWIVYVVIISIIYIITNELMYLSCHIYDKSSVFKKLQFLNFYLGKFVSIKSRSRIWVLFVYKYSNSLSPREIFRRLWEWRLQTLLHVLFPDCTECRIVTVQKYSK